MRTSIQYLKVTFFQPSKHTAYNSTNSPYENSLLLLLKMNYIHNYTKKQTDYHLALFSLSVKMLFILLFTPKMLAVIYYLSAVPKDLVVSETNQHKLLYGTA